MAFIDLPADLSHVHFVTPIPLIGTVVSSDVEARDYMTLRKLPCYASHLSIPIS